MSHVVIIIDESTGLEIGRYSPPHEEGETLVASEPQDSKLVVNLHNIAKGLGVNRVDNLLEKILEKVKK